MNVQKSQISIDKLVESIVREVIAELTKRGVAIGSSGVPERNVQAGHTGVGLNVEIDMSAYRTPVLTESQLTRIDTKVSTIVVPCTTVVTPGAWGIIRSRKLTLVRKTQPKG
jgi:hypothetical protein